MGTRWTRTRQTTVLSTKRCYGISKSSNRNISVTSKTIDSASKSWGLRQNDISTNICLSCSSRETIRITFRIKPLLCHSGIGRGKNCYFLSLKPRAFRIRCNLSKPCTWSILCNQSQCYKSCTCLVNTGLFLESLVPASVVKFNPIVLSCFSTLFPKFKTNMRF